MSTRNLKKSSSGFTLIELLIVVAIMGLLATAVYVAINPTQNLTDTRNSRRLSDMSAMQSALQAYWMANSYAYPTSVNVKTALTPTYISSIPVDPAGASYGYCRVAGAFIMGIGMEATGSPITNLMKSSATSMPAGCGAANWVNMDDPATAKTLAACNALNTAAAVYCVRGTGN